VVYFAFTDHKVHIRSPKGNLQAGDVEFRMEVMGAKITAEDATPPTAWRTLLLYSLICESNMSLCSACI